MCNFCSTFAAIFGNMSTRILIIDGDISLSTVLRDYLVSRGYQAAMEPMGREALSRLSSEHWDIVLMELQGLGMNGYELLKGIRHRLPKLPIFILSSRSDREDQMRAFELGADDYILKPFSMDLLICRTAPTPSIRFIRVSTARTSLHGRATCC